MVYTERTTNEEITHIKRNVPLGRDCYSLHYIVDMCTLDYHHGPVNYCNRYK